MQIAITYLTPSVLSNIFDKHYLLMFIYETFTTEHSLLQIGHLLLGW